MSKNNGGGKAKRCGQHLTVGGARNRRHRPRDWVVRCHVCGLYILIAQLAKSARASGERSSTTDDVGGDGDAVLSDTKCVSCGMRCDDRRRNPASWPLIIGRLCACVHVMCDIKRLECGSICPCCGYQQNPIHIVVWVYLW